MKRLCLVAISLLAFGLFSGVYGQEKELTIDECVQIALEQNPEIIRGEFTVRIAGKDVTIAMANFLPRVSSYLQYYHYEKGRTSPRFIQGIYFPAQPENQLDQYSSGFSVNQTILDGGYSIFNYSQRRNLKKSAEYNFEDTKQTMILLVKERYYNLLASEKLLNVAEETLRSSNESYKRAQVLFEVGKAPKSDVLQAKVQLETDRLGLIRAQNDLSIARASLNHVLGFDVDQKIKVVDNLDVPEMEVTYEDAMGNAMTYHPSLVKRTYDIKASKAGIGMSVSEWLPSLYGFFSYSWSHEDFSEISHMFEADYNWYAGVQLSIPIFQGFSRVATMGKAKLTHRSNQEALAQGKRDVALEVKQAYFEVQQAKKQIAVAQDAVEAAEEGLRLNQEKYKLGAGTMLDLIVAQVSYASAQSNHIQGLYNYKYAIARLQKAMGKLEK